MPTKEVTLASQRTAIPQRRNTEDELLTINETIRAMKVTRATFYRWRATGKGPKCLKLPSGAVRVRNSELERFLASCDE